MGHHVCSPSATGVSERPFRPQACAPHGAKTGSIHPKLSAGDPHPVPTPRGAISGLSAWWWRPRGSHPAISGALVWAGVGRGRGQGKKEPQEHTLKRQADSAIEAKRLPGERASCDTQSKSPRASWVSGARGEREGWPSESMGKARPFIWKDVYRKEASRKQNVSAGLSQSPPGTMAQEACCCWAVLGHGVKTGARCLSLIPQNKPEHCIHNACAAYLNNTCVTAVEQL
ncbi:uncharacterized protein LOC125147634 [Prionailurus viverrinus]|uniref:uncharacterized protein LOC125147634 n=1 Tax=Prionailurus viverrinus TaxID=61388 RepID=UPI001FF5E911|nr:uncharacterized protein LOC125147634 [Prionailurus viverrinus]